MTSQVELARVAPRVGSQEFLRTAFESPRTPEALLVVTVPAPLVPLEALFELGTPGDVVLWAPPDGPSFAGVGRAVSITGSGPGRFEEVERRAAETWSLLDARTLGEEPPGPRLFGGFSFESGWTEGTPWGPFGDARFVLPRLRYARAQGRAFLSLTVPAKEASSDEARAALRDEMEAAENALRSAAGRREVPAARPARTVTEQSGMTETEWCVLVETIRGRIASGDFEKVVAARRTTLSFESDVDPADVLSELALSQPSCTRFAYRFDGVTFVGASPERLVRRDGLFIDTEALAGSNRAGDAGRRELLSSTKDRAEHEPVVREIVGSLAPLCESLDYPETPEVRSLRHLQHLRTPVRGRLKGPIHVLRLVERLHPTPAVGGFPKAEAVRFIVEHEPSPRGWYASPVGSFDANGNGEFAVALRSGVLRGKDAFLFAGGGIVRDSNPESEFTETRLKLAALQAALRVVE